MAADSPQPQQTVLIRGLVRSRYHWLDFPQKLQTSLQMPVTCVELAGNGYRSGEDTPTGIGEAVEDLRRQVLPLKGQIHLVGISLGGMLATAWAQRYPDETASLVLINSSSSLSPFYERLRPAHYAGLLRQLLLRNSAALEEFILSATVNDEKIWRPLLPEFAAFQKEHPVKPANFVRQLRLASQVDFRKIPAAPKLILVAEGDRLVSPACSEVIARTWGCTIECHAHGGHDLTTDDPEWVTGQIRRWLNR